jgi:hypothetical protein
MFFVTLYLKFHGEVLAEEVHYKGLSECFYNVLKFFQVTTLVNTKGPSKKKKGRSKRAHVLVAAVEKATENFIEKGELIAYENPDIKQEMLSAVEEVRKTGV